MPTAAQVMPYRITSTLLSNPRGNARASYAMIDSNAVLTRDVNYGMMLWTVFAAILIGVGATWPLAGLLVMTFGLPFWWMFFMLFGFWCANQLTVKGTTPGSVFWRAFHPGVNKNDVLWAGLGLIMSPIVLFVVLPLYTLGRTIDTASRLIFRMSSDPYTRRKGEHIEIGQRHYWFKQMRESQRLNLTERSRLEFLLYTSIGVFFTASQLRNQYGSVDRVPHSEAIQFEKDMIAYLGVPKD